MARTEGDTWDAASGVGVTATLVAVGRAVASRATPPLIDDPFAAPLVRAVGIDVLTGIAEGTVSTEAGTGAGTEAGTDADAAADAAAADAGLYQLSTMMAVRTRFFDDFFLAAGDAGVRQVVILAAGLDARAHRLPWPPGTVVHEVDQPAVVDFTTRVYADLGAVPTAQRRVVAVDLRDDWPAALRAAGFDAGAATAWSAEGLLGYLPPDAQDRLIETVDALSGPGSRFAVEAVPSLDESHRTEASARSREMGERWRRHGLELDMADLIYFGERRSPAEHLGALGWTVDDVSLDALLQAHGLPPFDDGGAMFGAISYVTAQRA